MTNWLIDTLKRYTSWLENRRQPGLTVADFATRNELIAYQDAVTVTAMSHQEDIQKLKKEVEKLSLSIGLRHSIPTNARRA